MLYYLFHYLEQYHVPGARLFDYITFRSGFALILSLFIAIVIGHKIIERLQLMQVGELVRNLGLQGQMEKKGTPTMGGIIIIISIVVPCLLLGKLDNVYMLLMIISTLWLGALGFCDDYIKVAHHNKEGMKGKFKIVGQVGIGLIVGLTMWLSPQVVMCENPSVYSTTDTEQVVQQDDGTTVKARVTTTQSLPTKSVKSTKTTIPFVKNHDFDYAYLTKWMGDNAQLGGWIVFVLVVIFVVAAVSNGANLTDGLDGLATSTSAIIGVALAIMCYLGGNVIYSTYLNIMYIPNSAELVVYAASFIGATIGFLWYNSYPAQVFMGDTGSLCLGGIIAVFAILIRKELLIPILCLIFFVEDLSVIMQVGYFKYTKKRYGEGRRIFKMTPLHHHFQVPGGKVEARWQKPLQPVPEPKIVMRFALVAILLAVLTFVTLKVR